MKLVFSYQKLLQYNQKSRIKFVLCDCRYSDLGGSWPLLEPEAEPSDSAVAAESSGFAVVSGSSFVSSVIGGDMAFSEER